MPPSCLCPLSALMASLVGAAAPHWVLVGLCGLLGRFFLRTMTLSTELSTESLALASLQRELRGSMSFLYIHTWGKSPLREFTISISFALSTFTCFSVLCSIPFLV